MEEACAALEVSEEELAKRQEEVTRFFLSCSTPTTLYLHFVCSLCMCLCLCIFFFCPRFVCDCVIHVCARFFFLVCVLFVFMINCVGFLEGMLEKVV